MKILLTASLLLCAPALVLAQTASKPAAAKAPATAKAAAKPQAKAAPRKKAPSSRTEIQNSAKSMAAAVEAVEDALTPAEMAIAERIHVGTVPCELGASVTLASDPKSPGYFSVVGKNFKYRMVPVATSTGAIRLEDRKAGAVWLQLANKSMLMNQKAGQRLADECMSPEQVAFAENLKINPSTAPGLLDGPTAVAVPAGAGAPAPAAAPGASPVAQPVATDPATPATPAIPTTSDVVPTSPTSPTSPAAPAATPATSTR